MSACAYEINFMEDSFGIEARMFKNLAHGAQRPW